MNNEAEMKTLKVDLDELSFAMEDASGFVDYYLDLETSAIVTIDDETRWELEQIYEESFDPEAAEAFDLAEVLRQSDLHEWRQHKAICTSGGSRRCWRPIRWIENSSPATPACPRPPRTKAIVIWKISS
jgi:hypothetical protein